MRTAPSRSTDRLCFVTADGLDFASRAWSRRIVRGRTALAGLDADAIRRSESLQLRNVQLGVQLSASGCSPLLSCSCTCFNPSFICGCYGERFLLQQSEEHTR